MIILIVNMYGVLTVCQALELKSPTNITLFNPYSNTETVTTLSLFYYEETEAQEG